VEALTPVTSIVALARAFQPLYLANFPRNYSHFFFVTKEKKEKKTSPTQKKNETILA
jgi:hypothetical protein